MMFNPLGAFSSFGKGAAEGYEDPKLMNQIGMQALGKALFQPQQPMAPPPGQASMPSQPPPQAPPPQAPPQQAAQPMPPEMQNTPMAQQTNPMTAGLPGGGPQQQGQGAASGGPQPMAMPPQQMAGGQQGMDLPGLIGRIRNANPGIPPQAMMAALNHAMPILNLQARDQLLQMRRQMYGLNAPLRSRAMDLREQELNQRGQKLGAKGGGGGGPSPQALDALQEGYVTTFGNGQQWTLQDGAPVQVDGGGGGMGEGGGQGGYRGPEIPLDSFPEGKKDPYLNPDPYAGNASPQEAHAMRQRLGLPQTIDEFRRHFGRDPSTDSEMDAYSDQMGGKTPFVPPPGGMERSGRTNLRRRTGPLYE